MPAWSADWTDVEFDHVAAEEAAGACERAARVLRDSTVRIRAAAVAGAADGTGPWRSRFDGDATDLAVQSMVAEAELRRTVRVLRDASDRARYDQAARVAGRQQWQLEVRVELAAAATAAGPPAAPSPLPPPPA